MSSVEEKMEKYKQLHRNDEKAEGYSLKEVEEVFVPFWYCKQNVFIELNADADDFSKIILSYIEMGISSHLDLCANLGIDQDAFVLCHLHYLLKYKSHHCLNRTKIAPPLLEREDQAQS